MRKLLSEFIIVWFCLASITGCARTLKLEPFTNDGCTFFPNRSFNSDTDWSVCCLEHDQAYWQGGTEEERWVTDQVFRDCIIRETNNEILADLMFGLAAPRTSRHGTAGDTVGSTAGVTAR